ncbi:hypothetical protein [Pseudomonas extremaustralis]|uniref:hypothetical protein n=1 Tax=Pseudomonas extremaustralis TaxID=359110 RepID=UPI00230803B4|nr:hypothetical protein [Pseudomonas extremaustralis]MDB1112821.1 hypothetical protein [Pseudomonas extremaustralis]
MPTVGWIQETGLDRYWETGSPLDFSPVPVSYPCRHCGLSFDSISQRDTHEIEHPIQNPTLYFQDKDIAGKYLRITSPIKSGDLAARNVSNLAINGVNGQTVDALFEHIRGVQKAYIDVSYGNSALQKTLKIEVCIADMQELNKVDQAFSLHFSKDDFTNSDIAAFIDNVKQHRTVTEYINGLVRYLHGAMAKDRRSSTTPFEDFDLRFNQALQSLQEYRTSLSMAIRVVIRFNRNDFSTFQICGLPEIEAAMQFFRGGQYTSSGLVDSSVRMPVDFSTEFSLKELLGSYQEASLQDMEQQIGALSANNLSLQDRSKFDYICYRKAVEQGDVSGMDKYRRKLRFDDVFNTLIGEQ